MGNSPRIYPRKTMEPNQRIISQNDVNGSSVNTGAATSGQDDYVSQVSPVRHQATVNNREILRIGTWNVNTLFQAGKYDNLKKEMNRMKMDFVGVSEVRWKGTGRCGSDGVEFIYSGGEEHQRGVGVMMTARMAKCMKGYMALSDRVILVKIAGKPIDLNIIQVYAPTGDHPDDEVEEFYDIMGQALRHCKPNEIIIVMGDLNAKIGEGRQGEVVGPYGLGDRNERGDKWIEWCEEKGQIIINSFIRLHPRRRWTWKSPDGQYKNQIDYFTINKRFRNAITKCKTYPGADVGNRCDHVPVVAQLRLKLKKIAKAQTVVRRDWGQLKREGTKSAFQLEVKNRFDVLQESQENQENEKHQVEKEWYSLQNALKEVTEQLIPEKRNIAKQRWMTDEILEMMEERRKVKGNAVRYEQMDREVKEKCKERKEEWLKESCEEIEELQKVNATRMYDKIKEMTGKKRTSRNSVVKDPQGNIIMDQDKVLKTWEEYVRKLYDDIREIRPETEIEIEGRLQGPPIIKEEVRKAIKGMKKGKAVGEDNISVEMIEALDKFGIERVTRLANLIYDTGYIPQKMRESIFITIPKKEGAMECEKHRTICIMSQLGKILLSIIRNRIEKKIDNNVGEEQYGFRKGKGTVNAIFVLRMIMERAIEVQKDIYLCFVDFEKAFDTVRHEDMINMLKDIGLDGKDIRVLKNLYWDQKAAVKIGNGKTNWIEIRRGVRQGCVLSPALFSLYGQKCMEEIEELEGIRVGGRNINNIRYADDTVLIADSEVKLQRIIDGLSTACRRRGLKINTKKTEAMGLTKKKEGIRLNMNEQGKTIKQVDNFKYLGSTITDKAECGKEIKIRIAQAKTAFGKMRKILTNLSMNMNLRLRLMKCYVWSTLLYGSETWTMKKDMKKRLEAMEMWILRRMMRIPWTARITNEEVMRRAGVQRELMKEIRKRQLHFLGHALRAEGLERECLLGKIEGTRARGRQRIKFMDAILMELGDGRRVVDLVRLADDRQRWRSMVSNVT